MNKTIYVGKTDDDGNVVDCTEIPTIRFHKARGAGLEKIDADAAKKFLSAEAEKAQETRQKNAEARAKTDGDQQKKKPGRKPKQSDA